MLCSLKYCVRSINKSSLLIGCRSVSHLSEQAQSQFGKNGHYDIVIVGGGAVGLSLVGAIGSSKPEFNRI